MKFLNGKWGFLLAGTLLGAALLGGVLIYGNDAGFFNTLNATGEWVETELSRARDGNFFSFNAQIAVLLGIFLGAGLGALASGNFKLRFGDDGGIFLSILRNLAGGFLVMTGILVAMETIWGNFGGAARLSGSSWVFFGALCGAGLLPSLFGNRTKSAADKKPAKTPAGKGAAK